MMNINYTKAHKSKLKRNFSLFDERSTRHEPRTEGGDYRTDRRFELRCIEHPWFEVVIDVSIYTAVATCARPYCASLLPPTA